MFDQDQGRLPGGRLFRLRRVTWKSTPSNQGCLLLVWPFLRQGSFTPVPLRGPAAIRHPWRGAALAASMPLGPLRETCVQPAPKSRFVSSGRYVFEDQDQKQSKATASRLKPVPLTVTSPYRRSRLAGECILSVDIFIRDPPRSPASRLLQKKCVPPATTMTPIVPTLRVVTPPQTLRVPQTTRIQAWGVTQSVTGCIPTRRVGTISFLS